MANSKDRTMGEIPEDIKIAAQKVADDIEASDSILQDDGYIHADGVEIIGLAIFAEQQKWADAMKNPAAVRVNYLRGDIACQNLIDEAVAAERERCASKVARPDPSDWSVPAFDEQELLEHIRTEILHPSPTVSPEIE